MSASPPVDLHSAGGRKEAKAGKVGAAGAAATADGRRMVEWRVVGCRLSQLAVLSTRPTAIATPQPRWAFLDKELLDGVGGGIRGRGVTVELGLCAALSCTTAVPVLWWHHPTPLPSRFVTLSRVAEELGRDMQMRAAERPGKFCFLLL